VFNQAEEIEARKPLDARKLWRPIRGSVRCSNFYDTCTDASVWGDPLLSL